MLLAHAGPSSGSTSSAELVNWPTTACRCAYVPNPRVRACRIWCVFIFVFKYDTEILWIGSHNYIMMRQVKFYGKDSV